MTTLCVRPTEGQACQFLHLTSVQAGLEVELDQGFEPRGQDKPNCRQLPALAVKCRQVGPIEEKNRQSTGPVHFHYGPRPQSTSSGQTKGTRTCLHCANNPDKDKDDFL